MRKALVCLLLAVSTAASAKTKSQERSLQDYLKQFPVASSSPEISSAGSLYTPSGILGDPASDFTAHSVGDTIVISVIEQTTTQNSSSVNTKRDYSASTSIDGMAGKFNISGLQPIFSGSGTSQLQGSGDAASQSQLQTTLTGQIVAVLPNRNLVVEARRSVQMNNEKQTVILRGVVRPSDVSRGNSIVSTQLSNLELEVKGKGVLSDSTRPPNIIIRTLLKLVGF